MTPSIAPLRNVVGLIGLIDQVQTREFSLPGMGVYHGPSGWGKTTGVTFAANEFNAYVVQVKDCWTPTYLAQAIMRELGATPMRGVAPMVDAIGAQLGRTDRPLIIDDAQYLLRKRMIELVRDIYESSHVPVILVGEEKLPQDLTKWENIHNRVLAWEAAQPCDLSDAELLAPIYAKDITLDPALLALIVDASGGSIRRVAINLSRVRHMALDQGSNSMTLAEWGEGSFETGMPPAQRNLPTVVRSTSSATVAELPRKRGSA